MFLSSTSPMHTFLFNDASISKMISPMQLCAWLLEHSGAAVCLPDQRVTRCSSQCMVIGWCYYYLIPRQLCPDEALGGGIAGGWHGIAGGWQCADSLRYADSQTSGRVQCIGRHCLQLKAEEINWAVGQMRLPGPLTPVHMSRTPSHSCGRPHAVDMKYTSLGWNG